ncbi:hypothetical protein [Sulfitobacter sp. M22]|nr:hypothetical protein [Sulfitobacter sp. M22]MCF7728683.1 hypothetical protein [Sulfitobacter sp. M22]
MTYKQAAIKAFNDDANDEQRLSQLRAEYAANKAIADSAKEMLARALSDA